MFNDVTNALTYYRVPYDYEAAADKILAAGMIIDGVLDEPAQTK